MSVTIDGSNLTIELVERVARARETVSLAPECWGRIDASQAVVQRLVEEDKPVYGVTTGIGEFARIRISQAQCEELQKRIIYSHAAGVGDVQPPGVVRAAMLARLSVLAKGLSGVRASTVQLYMDILNCGIAPVVYEKGSVGCSGDLSPLSQLALVVLGEGEAFYDGVRMSGAEALQRAGLEPLRPTYKEGLGLINGTQMMTGEAALYLCDTLRLYKHALIAYAMALDALKAVVRAYDAAVHAVRPYPGAIATAAALRQIFAGSEILADPSGKVQDGYSMRCTPQIFGASLDAFHFVRRQVETELNSAIDNPLFFPDSGEYFARGQLPRPAGGDGDGLPLHRHGRVRQPRRAPHQPPAQPGALGPAGLPRRGQGAEQRPDGRAVHAGGAVQREPRALPPGRRGQRQRFSGPGGPRQHGPGRRAQVQGDPDATRRPSSPSRCTRHARRSTSACAASR